MSYSINHVVNKSGRKIPIRLKDTGKVTAYLEPKIAQNLVRVTATVQRETYQKIWDILSEACSKNSLSAYAVYKLVQLSAANFNKLSQNHVHPDVLDRLSDVKYMYRNIWDDPSKEGKKKKWARIKQTTVDQGPPSGPDLKILSTVASFTADNVVELLTFDSDFTLFAEEILNDFGVSVKNGRYI